MLIRSRQRQHGGHNPGSKHRAGTILSARTMIQVNVGTTMTAIGAALAACAMSYSLVACIASRVTRHRVRAVTDVSDTPVTVLKPLCGDERNLLSCLRSFCDQDHRNLQIICGVRDAHDGAIPVARQLQREYPDLDLQLVINPSQHGDNAKVSNLINMLPFARHEFLIISDSDVSVAAGYVAAVVAPLTDPKVGLVTCEYRGVASSSLWSRLGALFINAWFMPATRVAALFGAQNYASGVTLALRRETLVRIGGLSAIGDQLADDFWLGELIRRSGLRTVVADVTVDTCVDEASLAQLAAHELRWLRTIRAIEPLGYSLSFVTFGVPVAILGTLVANGKAGTIIMLAITLVARGLLLVGGARRGLRDFWLVPFSDLLIFALWCWSFTGRRVSWRQQRYETSAGGAARRVA